MMHKTTLEEISQRYETKKDYDYINTMLAFDIFKKDIEGKEILEIGCADGAMTEKLVECAGRVDVVEPSARYCKMIRELEKVNTIYNCFLDEIKDIKQYDVVVLAGLIHHIENPDEFLCIVKNFLKKDAIVLSTVPNVKSLHRKIGVKMGLLNNEYGDSKRNLEFKQFGRYDIENFKSLFEKNGYRIIESFGYMIKPFSSEIMETIDLSKKQISAMFEVGKEFQDISSQIYLKAQI